jgi:hypothetical protein
MFETANALESSDKVKGVILHWDFHRFAGIVERMLGLAAMLWVSPFALPVPFLPRLATLHRLDARARRRRLATLVGGAVFCAIIYSLLVAGDVASVSSILP